jgi:hypothetical protein
MEALPTPGVTASMCRWLCSRRNRGKPIALPIERNVQQCTPGVETRTASPKRGACSVPRSCWPQGWNVAAQAASTTTGSSERGRPMVLSRWKYQATIPLSIWERNEAEHASLGIEAAPPWPKPAAHRDSHPLLTGSRWPPPCTPRVALARVQSVPCPCRRFFSTTEAHRVCDSWQRGWFTPTALPNLAFLSSFSSST